MTSKKAAGTGSAKEDQIDPKSKMTEGEKKIFVVEDEQMLRDLYTDILTLKGHQVVSFSSGEEAVEGWKDNTYKLIICDLGLPGMDGWELIEKIRKRDMSIPVVVLTGWADNMDRQRIEDCNVQRILSKPVTIDQLLDTISELCG